MISSRSDQSGWNADSKWILLAPWTRPSLLMACVRMRLGTRDSLWGSCNEHWTQLAGSKRQAPMPRFHWQKAASSGRYVSSWKWKYSDFPKALTQYIKHCIITFISLALLSKDHLWVFCLFVLKSAYSLLLSLWPYSHKGTRSDLEIVRK